jgi:hypothetical protein
MVPDLPPSATWAGSRGISAAGAGDLGGGKFEVEAGSFIFAGSIPGSFAPVDRRLRSGSGTPAVARTSNRA